MKQEPNDHKQITDVDRIAQPRQELPIDTILMPFQRLLKSERTGSMLLILCTIVALVWANSAWGESYHELWETHFRIGIPGFELDKSLLHWINDGLMAIFFFFVGLEIKREVLVGDLASPRKAALPIAAAIGGMLLPASIYAAFNAGGAGEAGWGIPMATDIAFSLGILGLLRGRVPAALSVFLAALAIADDLGAVIVIGLFYTAQISWASLAVAAVLLALLALINRAGVRSPAIYAIVGVCVWIAVLKSGVHATIAGVLTAMTVPARTRIDPQEFLHRGKLLLMEFDRTSRTVEESTRSDDFDAIVDTLEESCEQVMTPLGRMEHALYGWISLLILPIFALANAGVVISGDGVSWLSSSIVLGIVAGLVAGKTIGIWLFSRLVVAIGIAQMPDGVNGRHLLGTACLGGIGFTMSLFIAGLAFADAGLLAEAKLGILAGSVIAGIAGVIVLRKS